jgi:hypothetical protein
MIFARSPKLALAAESIEGEIGQVGQTQKAARELSSGTIKFNPTAEHFCSVLQSNMRDIATQVGSF